MRIFHNETTNQIIVVSEKSAWSIYGYDTDTPIDVAQRLLDSNLINPSSFSVCEEIELPQTPAIEPNHILEKPTDSIGQIQNSPKSGEPKCEHSQKKNKTH